MLYDDKDIRIIAGAINAVAPDSIEQKSRLVLQAAMSTGLVCQDLERAIEWWRETLDTRNVR